MRAWSGSARAPKRAPRCGRSSVRPAGCPAPIPAPDREAVRRAGATQIDDRAVGEPLRDLDRDALAQAAVPSFGVHRARRAAEVRGPALTDGEARRRGRAVDRSECRIGRAGRVRALHERPGRRRGGRSRGADDCRAPDNRGDRGGEDELSDFRANPTFRAGVTSRSGLPRCSLGTWSSGAWPSRTSIIDPP